MRGKMHKHKSGRKFSRIEIAIQIALLLFAIAIIVGKIIAG